MAYFRKYSEQKKKYFIRKQTYKRIITAYNLSNHRPSA